MTLALLVALGALSSESTSFGPQPRGQTALVALAGQPFWSLRLDHGLTERVDVGLGLDLAPRGGLMRPMAVGRARLASFGRWRASLLGAVGAALPMPKARPMRRVLRTLESELSAQVDYQLPSRVTAVAEVGMLASSDFSADHTMTLMRGLVGAEWAPLMPFSLLAQGGALWGSRGPRAIGAAGAAFRFR